jgi:hypothetical protein
MVVEKCDELRAESLNLGIKGQLHRYSSPTASNYRHYASLDAGKRILFSR